MSYDHATCRQKQYFQWSIKWDTSNFIKAVNVTY